MLPPNVSRVPIHTAAQVNAEIYKRTQVNVLQFSRMGPDAIDERLQQIDYEWDIERLLEANASVAMLLGLTLGFTVNRRLLIVPGAVAGFLLMHALQGWCPPLPIFRRLGFRTASEIDYERYALKALRGDFEAVRVRPGESDTRSVDVALAATQS